jgi:hypothetical protein
MLDTEEEMMEENNFVNETEGHIEETYEEIEGVEDNDTIVDGFNQAWKNFDVEDMRLALDTIKTLAYSLAPLEPLGIVLLRVLTLKDKT